MKADLTTTIVVAIFGVIIAYFAGNFILPNVDEMKESYKTIEDSISSSIEEPNEDIFNSRAINPTVEVCVGTCDNVEDESVDENVDDANGEVVDNGTSD